MEKPTLISAEQMNSWVARQERLDATAAKIHQDLLTHNESDLRKVTSTIAPEDIFRVEHLYESTYKTNLKAEIEKDPSLGLETKGLVKRNLSQGKREDPMSVLDDALVGITMQRTMFQLNNDVHGVAVAKFDMARLNAELIGCPTNSRYPAEAYEQAQQLYRTSEADIVKTLTSWSDGQLSALDRYSRLNGKVGILRALTTDGDLAASTREMANERLHGVSRRPDL